MAATVIDSNHALRVRQWDDKAFNEYLDKLVLKNYMGMDTESLIQVKENLMKAKGDQITLGLAAGLKSQGVIGEAAMEGNEEAMIFRDYSVTLQQYKNAVRLNGSLTAQRTAFDMKDEARPSLTTWLAQFVENKLFNALNSIDGVDYATSTSTQRNTWLTNNADRVLFGNAKANNASNVHASSLLNVDTTNDGLSTDVISLAKRMAQLADPKIRPIKLENGEEWYVMFVHNLCARDLKATTNWKQAQQYAQNRGMDNPLFTGALGTWDGVVLVESPKCPLLAGVGASSSDVGVNFLCGAQALVLAQGGYQDRAGAKVAMTEKLFDYDEQWGVQIKTMFGHGKAVFNNKQHGVVTVYASGVQD